MATRANLEVFSLPDGMLAEGREFEPKKGLVMLYRHWDGYPEEDAGVFATWQQFYEAHYPTGLNYGYYNPLNVITEAIKYFWMEKENDWEDEKGRPGLELTEGLHGDIDYYYQLLFDAQNVTIKAYERAGSTLDNSFNPKGSYVGEIKIPNFKKGP